MSLRYITGEEIRKLVTYADLINYVEKALVSFSNNKTEVDQPLRTIINVSGKGILGSMPCYSGPDNVLACKLVTYFPQNTEIPTHQGIVLLFNPDNGCLLSTMDGESITEMRTAAASAVASRHLANPQSEILALIGSGTQAFGHFEAIASQFELKEVRIFSPNQEKRQKIMTRITSESTFFNSNLQIKLCTSVKDAVDQADIVCTVTGATQPILDGDWLKPGCHVNAVGACKAHERELFPTVTNRAFVVVDSLTSAQSESGDIIINKAEIGAELGAYIINKTMFEHKKHTKDITLFKSLGIGIEDAVTAKLVWDRLATVNQ